MAKKVHVHRWPMESPPWDDSITGKINESINKNPAKKEIRIGDKTIQIQGVEFASLKKIGISVPFFKEECTLIFEAQFGEGLFAHVHITVKSVNFPDVFEQLISWKRRSFPSDPKV